MPGDDLCYGVRDTPPVAERQGTLEQRVRRMAERQGLRLRGSRRQDPLATDYGQWRVETARGRVLRLGHLDELQRWLATPPAER